ncbi:unnamed protein product [Dracunculus medinensis]|uniref:Uncharacterized protein n=1 Tax=Dracunculus medinensis TaxID=318479 RepID=A0A0N4U802_DRAME|nr:unnamed protein product [Dracunculus medinensis]
MKCERGREYERERECKRGYKYEHKREYKYERECEREREYERGHKYGCLRNITDNIINSPMRCLFLQTLGRFKEHSLIK